MRLVFIFINILYHSFIKLHTNISIHMLMLLRYF